MTMKKKKHKQTWKHFHKFLTINPLFSLCQWQSLGQEYLITCTVSASMMADLFSAYADTTLADTVVAFLEQD